MRKLLEDIREISHFVTQAVYFYRKQNYAKGHMLSTTVVNRVEKYFYDAEEAGFTESASFLLPVWNNLLEATENGDEICLADIYDNQLMPALFEIQSCLLNELGGEPIVYWEDNMNLLKDKDIELFEILKDATENENREYILSFANTGDAVLSVGTEQYGKVMLSSCINPWQEAVVYGDSLNDKIARRCVIFGLGMGYHVRYIASLPYFREIIVLESDLEQLRICMMYTDMKNLLSKKKVKIILCNKVTDYSEWLKENSKEEDIIYKIWYPSIKTVEDDTIRELLENYWINISSADNLGNVLLSNFERNQELADEPVDVLQKDFKDKDLVIVGAGPSLDDSLDYLRKFSSKENVRIICVGKAAKKLISENIMPSYIVMIDGKAGTRWQIKGIENCGVPLIYLSTVAHNVAADYKGKRYIAYQEGIELSKEYADKNNLMIFQSGGSVATFAIDMAIHMKCLRIICVGLDMGYTGDNTHAGGIGRKIKNKKSLRKVEAVGGGEVYTSKTLDIYRRWIERRIENVKNIKFINASSGARIHGMEEKSLKEINAAYCKQTIFCYVENQEDALDKFVAEHNNDSLIHILLSIIDSCEGKLYYCLCYIINNYIKSDKTLWFATDVKSLYDTVKEIFSFLFEKIIYIEQENKREFDSKFDIKILINYFINLQADTHYALLMKDLWTLKEDKNLEHIIQFLDNLRKAKIEKDKKLTELWCCFCELLLYEIKDMLSGKQYFYYKLALYSILMKLSKNADYTNRYLCETLNNGDIENMYFVYHQLKRKMFTGQVVFDKESGNILNKLYDKCYEGFINDLKEYLVKIPLAERNKNLVMILTVQFLEERHAPTSSIIERVKAYRALGKNVVIINTAEICLMNGYVPIYNIDIGNVLKEYDDINEIKIGQSKTAFLQIPKELPIPYKMQVLAHMINKIKPYYILSVGTGSVLADLCGNMVPCASMAVVFSTLPYTKNNMRIIGRKLTEKELENCKDKDYDVIESRFTFELKPQRSTFLRKELGIPEEAFVLIVIGTRLQFDITDKFMEMLQQVCAEGCYVIFAGIMDNHIELMKRYPIVAKNSLFKGYCEDILALMEICDLYVNPDRAGGGFSVIEAFSKGKPGVYLKKGDVYTAGGQDFAVDNLDVMAKQILRYKDDKEYYDRMAKLAKERAKLMTSSIEAMADIDRQICQRVEEKYW